MLLLGLLATLMAVEGLGLVVGAILLFAKVDHLVSAA